MVDEVNVLICPEAKSSYFVSLWTIGSDSADVKRASAINWIALSGRLQASRAISDSTLGAIDACIGRGEPIGFLMPSLHHFDELSFVSAESAPKIRNLVRLTP